MGWHKERVLGYRKYCPFEVIELHPERTTPDECMEMLRNNVGRNSTIYIEEDTRTTDIIRPQIFVDVKKLDPTEQQNFLDTKASSIKKARRVFVKTSTLPLHSN